MTNERTHAMDHIIVILFENRSFDNVLGHLYGPDDKNFEGVIGKNLSNPIPEWAEHGADRKVVPYSVAKAWTPRIRTRAKSTSTPTPSSTTRSTP